MFPKSRLRRPKLRRILGLALSLAFLPKAYGDPLTIKVRELSRWDGGASLSVILTNEGDEPIEGWEADWRWPGDEIVTFNWDSQLTQSGRDVRVLPVTKNEIIPAKRAVTFGFNVSGNALAEPQVNVSYAETPPEEPPPPDNGGGDPAPEDPSPPAPADGWSVAPEAVVAYDVRSDWGSGFMVNVVVKNNGDAPLENWRVRWEWPGGQAVTYSWNADFALDGKSVTVTPTAANASIPAKQLIAFGSTAAPPPPPPHSPSWRSTARSQHRRTTAAEPLRPRPRQA